VPVRCDAPLRADGCKPVTGSWATGGFFDHDDSNLIFDSTRNRWVDLQMFFVPASLLNRTKPYCDNAATDHIRTLSYRTSGDGVRWSRDAACSVQQAGPGPSAQYCPGPFILTKSTIRAPNAQDGDSEEMQFYRVRPFRLGGGSQRMAAHTLLYAPSPIDVPAEARCLGGHGLPGKCCHGAHLPDELWVGPVSNDPTDMAGWQRPSPETPFTPLDIFLSPSQLFWGSDTCLWTQGGRRGLCGACHFIASQDCAHERTVHLPHRSSTCHKLDLH